MYNKQFKKIALLLILGSFAAAVSAQQSPTLLKLGNNPYTINDKAALEVESTTRGFLLPRMTRLERNAILAPVAGLQVWCTDCNGSSGPYIYTGTAWATIASSIAKSTLTTGKMGEANAPVWLSTNTATINGVLVQPSQALPTETGIVLKEIIGNDFASLPYLDAAGNNTTTVFKTPTASPVTVAGGTITKNVVLNPGTSTNPFYFSTYAKTPLGVDYGNPVVFNCADPVLPVPIYTTENNSSLMPVCNGELTINAGTPVGAIKEYGYVCGLNNTSPLKTKLSTTVDIDNINTYLTSDTFTQNYKITLPTVKYDVTAVGGYFFRYYIIFTKGGVETYLPGPAYSWSATADPVTGGTAVATYDSVGVLTPSLNFRVPANSVFPVVFNVKKIGTYGLINFGSSTTGGATTGLAGANDVGGTFSNLGLQTINYRVTGTPRTSLEGNTFSNIPRLPVGVTFNTGAMPSSLAVCNAISTTTLVEVTGPSGRIWMDRNLGASAAAESIGDIRAFGCLFQWGRGNDGHANVTWGATGELTNGTTATLSSTMTPGHNKFIIPSSFPYDWITTQTNFPLNYINNPCPSGFRLPQYSEANADFGSFGSEDPNNGYAKLKLVASAYAGSNGNIAGQYEQITQYWLGLWSGTTVGTTLLLYSGYKDASSQYRASGFPVRCIKDMGFLPTVSTGKKSDPTNAPVYVSASSATIRGTLLTLPSQGLDNSVRESGIIWKEITNDFAIFPKLPERGLVAPPVYKKETSSVVDTVNGSIVVTTPATLNANPYYYRAYVINVWGNVAYGDPVIFNVAPPTITDPIVTPGTPKPTIAGTLIVNAGTDKNIVTEYGYSVGTTNPPTILVPLSTPTTIANLNASLDGETFTANPSITLPVSSYTVTPNVVNYFRYYVKGRNGVITYSNTVSFTPTGL
jgi:hypothetical protein